MKKYLTWIKLISKHILKKPLIPILLLCIPLISFLISLIPSFNEGTSLNIGVYFEGGDDLSVAMKEQLLNREDAFEFTLYEDTELLKEDVLMGRLECGYIFDKDFSSSVDKGKYKNSIKLFVSSSTLLDSSVNEVVFASLLQLCGYEIITDYVTEAGIEISNDEDALSFLISEYERYCEGGETFYLDIETVSGINLNEGGNDTLGVSFPLRGMLAILIFLAGMLGAVTWLNDNENGLFSAYSTAFKTACRILYILIPAGLFILCGELTLLLTGNGRAPLAELFISLRYLIIIVLFCNICMALLRKSSIVTALIPVLIIGSLIFCPIFINLESLIPVFRIIAKFFVPGYFL